MALESGIRRFLFLTMMIFAFSPVAMAREPRQPEDVPTLGEIIDIAVTPGEGPPGTQLIITRTDGTGTFATGAWKVGFRFSKPGHVDTGGWLDAQLSIPQLRFKVPLDAGCGVYNIFVALSPSAPRGPLALSNIVPFRVTGPCVEVPTITRLSANWGSPGQKLTAEGTNFQAQLQVELMRTSPLPRSGTKFGTSEVTPTRLAFTLPSYDVADRYCGTTRIALVDPRIRTGSNLVPLTFSCPPNTLNVLSYNIRFLPEIRVPPFGPCVRSCEGTEKRGERLERIARSPIMDFHDVVIFQEAFSDSHRLKLLNRLEDRYPHRTRILGSDRGVEQDGGVIILSKWPIENSPGQQRLFGDTCAGDFTTEIVCRTEGGPCSVGVDMDCSADKGVLYARVNKEGRRYHIFGTHLDSGGQRADVSARKQQLEIISRFISELNIPANEPVIIAGDFNITPLGDLGGGDPTRDLYVAGLPLRGSGSGATHVNGEEIDYIFYSKVHLMPVRDSSFREVLRATGGPSGKPFHGNLSDHHPLAAKFVFPQLLEVTPIRLPRRGPGR